jgi:outer membrane scaffolding protein for murein synthesis (MipA/OmpV family)
VTWADRDYTMTFFGVTPAQSAASGLPAYEADSGFNTVRFGVGATYRLDRRWHVGARAAIWRIVGDAADSPITRERTPYTIGVFGMYRI